MNPTFYDTERAVTEIVGSLLLVGVTVVAMAGFAAVIFAMERPHAALRPDLQFTVTSGPGDWGDGDEEVVVRHVGGDVLPRDQIRIVLLSGPDLHVQVGDALDSGFADGRLTTGESWSWTGRIAATDGIGIDVIDLEARRIVATHAVAPTDGGGSP